MCEDRIIKDDEPVTWGDFAENIGQIANETNKIYDRIETLEKQVDKLIELVNKLLDKYEGGRNEKSVKAAN